jgi:hypothetical protein
MGFNVIELCLHDSILTVHIVFQWKKRQGRTVAVTDFFLNLLSSKLQIFLCVLLELEMISSWSLEAHY